jgi:hypothetical protein
MIALQSAAPSALNALNEEKLSSLPPEQVSAFAIGLAKKQQQAFHCAMHRLAMNYLRDKVFTQRDVHASDDDKLHFGN